MEPIVHFDNVTKLYGQYKAVDALDLKIESGKFVTLLGPSGCGKSTTLRMLGGFEIPNTGRILLGGKDVTRLPPNRRNVNIVFQDYALFPHMTIARNIAFGMELQGRKSDEIHRRVTELLNLVQLEDYADRMPAQLSGGQRQRVALMRALAPDPQVLLLDEPLSALDAKLRQQMQIELKSIQEKTGKTFLFVTHDQDEAITMSDQIVVMNKGRIEQIGDPHTLYGRPRSRFVANFIGETNLLECIVEDSDERSAALRWDEISLRAAVNDVRPRSGDRIHVAIRPEAIHCTPDGQMGVNSLPGRIDQRIFKGNHTSLKIEVASGCYLNALVDPASSSRLSDPHIWVHWNENNAVILQD